MRRLAALTLTALALALGAYMLGTSTASATPAPALVPSPVHGIYDVPTGTLTVRQDGTAMYVPIPDLIPGACEVDTTNATTGEQHRPFYACAPLHAPDGAEVSVIFPDDGSASYDGSVWYLDPDLSGFAPSLPVGEAS